MTRKRTLTGSAHAAGRTVKCALAVSAARGRLPYPVGTVRDVAILGDDHSVSVSSTGGDESFAFVLSEWRKGSEQRLLELADEQYERGDGLIVANGSWWYSAERTSAHGSEIVFAVPGAEAQVATTIIRLPAGAMPLHWMPLQGGSPSGLFISSMRDGSFSADLVAPDGLRHIAQLDNFRGFAPQRGGAVMLPGNVVALVDADGTWPVPAALTLRLLSVKNGVTETTLPSCNVGPLSAIAIAAGGDGSIGILATSQEGQAAAAVVDPAAVARTKWQTIPTSKDRATLPRIVASGNRFAAAWLHDGIVSMTAVPATEPATVTRTADINVPLLIVRTGADGRLDLIWRERGGDLAFAAPPFP